MSLPLDREGNVLKVLNLAARQCGVIARTQALALGMTPAAVKAQVRAVRWRPVEPGLFVVNGSPDKREQRLWLAVVGAGAGAVLSHTTAASLYRLLAATNEVHVTVRNGGHHISGPLRIVHQARTLGRADITRIGDYPVTTPLRTLVDLVGLLPAGRFEAVLDTALMEKLVSLRRLERYVDGKRFKGAGQLRRLVNDRKRGVSQEEMERMFDRNVIKRFKLPKPKRQWPFAGNKRIDAAYPDLGIAIELDSWRYHGSLLAFRADRPRQNILELDGWMVLRFTWDAIRYRPQEVADTILKALGRRAPARASRTPVSRTRGSG